MAALALDGNGKLVSRRHQRTGPAGQHAEGCIGHDVQREGRIGQRIDQPVFEHEARTVMALFARLEHEIHRSCNVVAHRA